MGASEKTIRGYFNYLNYFVKFLSSNDIKEFSQVTRTTFIQFKRSLKKQGLKPKSIETIISISRRLLRFLNLDHVFHKKPVVPQLDSPLFTHLQDFLNYLQVDRGYSQNTILTYSRHNRKFIEFLIKENINDITEVTEDLFIKHLSAIQKKKLSSSSVRSFVEGCKSFFKFLKKEDVIPKNPLALFQSPKVWQKVSDSLTELEISRLVESPDLKSMEGMRDRAILELLYGSGLRITELCELRVKHLNLEDKTVLVFGKGSKERIVPFTGSFLNALSAYWLRWRPNLKIDDFVFLAKPNSIKKMRRESLWLVVKKYAKKCGFKNKNVHPHSFRRCFATHLLDNGADLRIIQEMMGHSDVGTTGVYLQQSLKKVKEKFYKCHLRNVVEEPIEIQNKQVCND
jgi:integrase/recombinase XerD